MEFTASIDRLHQILQWIGQELEAMHFTATQMHKIELASEEALVNIFHHAYQGRPEKVEIQVLTFPKSHAEITFIDSGPSFNPLDARQVDLNQPFEKRTEGGLGIHFIRKCSDEVRYARIREKNVLTIRFSQTK